MWLYILGGFVIFGMFYEYARYAYKTNKFANYLKEESCNLSSIIVIEHLNTLKSAVIQCLIIHLLSIAGCIYLLNNIEIDDEVNYGIYCIIGLYIIHNFYVRKLNKERDQLIRLEVIKIQEVKTALVYEEMPTLREALQCHINKLEGSCKWTPS